MLRRPPRSTRTDTLFPYTTLFRSSALERCGFVLRDGTVVEITNVHDEPERGFRMAPARVLEYVDNPDLVGTWHTHPGGDPNLSQEDYAGFLHWPALEPLIVGTLDCETTTEPRSEERRVGKQCV